jgi:hypothetical protein
MYFGLMYKIVFKIYQLLQGCSSAGPFHVGMWVVSHAEKIQKIKSKNLFGYRTKIAVLLFYSHFPAILTCFLAVCMCTHFIQTQFVEERI